MRTFTLSLSLSLLVTSLVLAPGPSQAGPGPTCDTPGRVLVGVHPGAVSPGAPDYYKVPVAGELRVILIPASGTDVDLLVFPPWSACDSPTCHPQQPGNAVERCDVFPPLLTPHAHVVYLAVFHKAGSGDYTLVLAGGHALSPKAILDPFTTNRCIVYNDENSDGSAAPEERLLTSPCNDPAPVPETSGTCGAYNDANEDGDKDDGESLASTTCPTTAGVESVPNADGTCTTWLDLDGDGLQDPGEVRSTHACPDVESANDGERTTFYDDRNRNNQPDPNETLFVLENYP